VITLTEPANTSTSQAGHRPRLITLAGASDGESLASNYPPGELLGVVAGELAALGLAITDLRLGRILVAIEINNPSEPDKGTVCIGMDGCFIWQRRGALDGRNAVLGIVTSAISALRGEPS
jgi:hypothetical protein